MLQTKDPERWRAGVACDCLLVIEGPKATYRSGAMITLQETMATRLAECIPQVWDRNSEDEDGVTDVEEHPSGARFAIERSRDRIDLRGICLHRGQTAVAACAERSCCKHRVRGICRS